MIHWFTTIYSRYKVLCYSYVEAQISSCSTVVLLVFDA